jgi:hypothetical protein
MSESAPAAPASPAPAAPPAKKPASAGFTFTDGGCRTEVRVGGLLVLGAVFLWLWLGPQWATRLYLVGAPLLVIGIPWQVFESRRGRPGYPWKLGIAFTVFAALMYPDLRYRDDVGSTVQVQTVVPLLGLAGLWIVAWWPVAILARRAHLRETT